MKQNAHLTYDQNTYLGDMLFQILANKLVALTHTNNRRTYKETGK